MKKLVLFAAILSGTLVSNAQSGSSDESRFTLGTKGGFGHSWISSTDNNFNGSWFIGLGTMYQFSEHVGLGVDALYSSEGATYKGLDNSSAGSLQLDYFRIPVKLAYYFSPLASDLRPKIAVGINPGFLMRDPNSAADDLYEGMDFGANVMAGLDYRLLDGFWLTFDANYYNGFTDIYKGIGSSGSDMNRNLRLDIGLMIGF